MNEPAAPRRAFSVATFAIGPSGKVLLVEHKRLGAWLPVGGELEPGETPVEAARRELLEETGLTGEPIELGLPHVVTGTPPGLVTYEEHAAGSKGLHMNFCFVARVASEAVRGDGSFGAWRFVDEDEVQAMAAPDNVKQLVALARGVPPLVALARRWLRCFNGRDLDGLLSLYSDDAVHVSPKLRDRHPETKGEIRGKAALRTWWADAMKRLPGLVYEEQHLTAMGRRVFMEYLRRVPGEADLLVAEVLVVDERGRIAHSKVFHG